MGKTIKVWLAVNKNGFVGMYNDEPTRNTITGKWESNLPFVNSMLYTQMMDLVKNAKLTWESEPEYFEIKFEK